MELTVNAYIKPGETWSGNSTDSMVLQADATADGDIKVNKTEKVTYTKHDAVNIPDENLKKGICEALVVYLPGAQIEKLTQKNLERLESLSIDSSDDSSKIENLTGLEMAVKLKTLSLNNHNIKNLSPIANLNQLETVSLMNNQIEDISMLEELPNLKSAALSANPVGTYVFENYIAFPDRAVDISAGSVEVQMVTDVFALGIAEMKIEIPEAYKDYAAVRQSDDPNTVNIDLKKTGIVPVNVTYQGKSKEFSLIISDNDTIPEGDISIVSGNGFGISVPVNKERIEAFSKLNLKAQRPADGDAEEASVLNAFDKNGRAAAYQLSVEGTETNMNKAALFGPKAKVSFPVPEGWDASRTIVVEKIGQGFITMSGTAGDNGKTISVNSDAFTKEYSNVYTLLELSRPTETKDWEALIAAYIQDLRFINWSCGMEFKDHCYVGTPSVNHAAGMTLYRNRLNKYNTSSSYYSEQKNQLEIPYNTFVTDAKKIFKTLPNLKTVNMNDEFYYDEGSNMFIEKVGGRGSEPLVTQVHEVQDLGSGKYAVSFKVSRVGVSENPDMTDESQYQKYTLAVEDNGEGNWRYLSFEEGYVNKKPETPVTPVVPEKELPKETIDKVADQISNTQTGASVTVDMGTATVVPQKILESARGKDVDVVLEMNGYTWTINGKDITANDLKDINLEVKVNVNAIPQNVVNMLAGGNDTLQITLTHEGAFGFTADLSIYVGTEYAGKYASIFWYNNGKMEYIHSSAIDEQGYAVFPFSHASDYLVVMGDKPMSEKDIPKELRKGGSTTPQTGDTSGTWIYLTLLLFAGAAAATLYRKKVFK